MNKEKWKKIYKQGKIRFLISFYVKFIVISNLLALVARYLTEAYYVDDVSLLHIYSMHLPGGIILCIVGIPTAFAFWNYNNEKYL